MFVIYNPVTKLHMRNVRPFDTEAGAKCSLTRRVNAGHVKREDYTVISVEEFRKIPVPMETKINLMTGKEFTQPIGTPMVCDPSTETYWSF
jgi:hypothetical protein